MFLGTGQALEATGGGGARAFGRASPPPPTVAERLLRADLALDLGARIGSREWWRGLATCTALCAATWMLSPGMPRALPGDAPVPLAGAEADEARALAIAPLALGSGTGRRMGANDLVAPLPETPERPRIELSTTLGDSDSLGRALERAGVGRADVDAATALIAGIVDPSAITPGTRVALVLGRRADRTVARPLDRLSLRARFDMGVTLVRGAGGLQMTRQPIVIDTTPWRIEGLVGSGLYRSLRAAGAPAKIVEQYLKAMASRLSLGSDVAAADRFDLIVERDRAATGETRIGKLLFAGLERGKARRLQLVRFNPEGGTSSDEWFDAGGQAEHRGLLGMPVAGHITSRFGMRFHPILGFTRMHKGLDIGAPYGSPIYATIAGVVRFAGRTAGYGNFVKLAHAGNLGSGYGHMSRIAVHDGERVARGQVIGYVGSTGISTGPHLHWEIWRGGTAINPQSLSMTSVAQLSGEKLRAFKDRVAKLLAVKPGS